MANEFEINVGNDVVYTGLITPDVIPMTFAPFPPAKLLDLADLKTIYRNEKRKDATVIYTRRKNQGRKSSCAPYATTTGGELKRAFDLKDDVEFGPEYLYSLVNRGQDQGSLLDSCMLAFAGLDPRTHQKRRGFGCCLRASVPYQVHTLDSMSMEQRRFAEQEAEKFQALDYEKLPHGDHDLCWQATLSAVALRDPVLIAVHVGRNFMNTGPDGRCAVDRGVGNHAVNAADLRGVLQAATLRDIKISAINSHGKEFGDNGTYLHTYDHMAQPSQYHQHCACKSMRTSPDEEISTLLEV